MLTYNYTCDQTGEPLTRLIISPNAFYAPLNDGHRIVPTDEEQAVLDAIKDKTFGSLTAMAEYILENFKGI